MSTAHRQTKVIKRIGIKLHNRRVRGSLMLDGTIVWKFTTLCDNGEISEHNIRLSQEATQAMSAIFIGLTSGNGVVDTKEAE